MIKIKLKILNPEAKLPSYAHSGDVGMDVYALEDKTIAPSERVTLKCGFALEVPIGYGVFVKDKSSISKAGLHTFGGVFDAGYRGEYSVNLVNLSDKPYTIEKGDKTAQLVILPVLIPEIEIVKELSDSSRGAGSFGSTGKK